MVDFLGGADIQVIGLPQAGLGHRGFVGDIGSWGPGGVWAVSPLTARTVSQKMTLTLESFLVESFEFPANWKKIVKI